ncbi:MAG: hypothetical protein AAF517_27050, partial [Planctomycetota bacterium]
MDRIRPKRDITVRIPSGVLLITAMSLIGLVGLGAAANRYRVPRVVVVGISDVFENYSKKKDRQKELEGQMDVLKTTLSELEKEYEELNTELKTLEEDSPLYIE